MKILIPLVNFTFLTGAELYVHTLASELVKRGHAVTVASFNVGGDIAARTTKAGAKVLRFADVPKERYDIIASQQPQATRWALNAFPGTPIILTVHSEYECERPIIQPEITHYVYIRPSIRERWNLDSFRSTLVYNPIDFSRFNRENLTDEGFLLFVGSIYHLRKEASLDALERFPYTQIYFVGDKSGDYLDKLRNPRARWLPGTDWNIEILTKKCHATIGCLLGRSTIEGWACDKAGYIYDIDREGNINSVALHRPPADMTIFQKEHVVNQMEAIYERYV